MNIAAEGLRSRGIDLHCEYLGNLRSVGNLLAASTRLQKMAGEFDLVHAQYGSACGYATAAVKGIPKVLSIRGNDWNVHSASLGFFYVHTRLARWMTNASLRSYDVLLTVSRRVAADVQRHVSGATILPMPSPVDLKRFIPVDKAEARARLGFAECRERWVLFNAINLNDPVKRFSLAKRAFEIANARAGGSLRLRVATDLPHSQVPLFTAACDVILCTSETEGWPNCVKEALACNVPFVSTDVSDLADIARIDPSCRVCPDDAEVLAENLCDILGAKAPPDVRRHVTDMSVEALTDRLIAVYESLVRTDGERQVLAFAGS